MASPRIAAAPACSTGATVHAGNMPTATHSTTSTSTGIFIQRGGSCGMWSSARGPLPKNVS